MGQGRRGEGGAKRWEEGEGWSMGGEEEEREGRVGKRVGVGEAREVVGEAEEEGQGKKIGTRTLQLFVNAA